MANASFPPSLAQLQASLWSWTAQGDPTSELYKVLATLASSIDGLGDSFDLIWQSRSITTAQQDDLIGQYAYVWGVAQEELPPTVSAIRAYLIARSEEDGTIPSLVNTLLALIDATPTNLSGGPLLTFPSNGTGLIFPNPAGTSGLVWPMSGAGLMFDPAGAGIMFTGQPAGLTLYQFALGSEPSSGLTFPANGTGLIFPVLPLVGSNPDQGEANDGTPAYETVGSTVGLPLTFANNPYVTIIPNYPTFTVQVKGYLTFDRQAFARAVARFQLAHLLPGSIQEINTT